jgi:excisionase family DNA binding protein
MLRNAPHPDSDELILPVSCEGRRGVKNTRVAPTSSDDAGGAQATMTAHIGTGSELLITVSEAARRLSIARSHLYLLVQRRVVPSVHIGRSRRIRVHDLESFVEGLAGGPTGA